MTARADDNDFRLAAEPRPAKRVPRESGRGRRAASRRWAWLGLLTRRPARTIMGAVVTALLTSIVINALVLQKAKHPAPLFMPAQPPAAASPAQPHIAPANPARIAAPDEPKQKDAIAAILKPNAVEKPEAVLPTPAARPKDTKDTIAALLRGNAADRPRPEKEPADAKSKDAIAGLLKTNSAGAAGAEEPSRETVAAVQQALLRLGFVLRADGVFGTTTKQAIELFERDHHLQVDGELSPRLTRQLAATSGLAIP